MEFVKCEATQPASFGKAAECARGASFQRQEDKEKERENDCCLRKIKYAQAALVYQ